jgi:catechol 2,3-dioxygenase-like lactoylglutathione lyase family enzyme
MSSKLQILVEADDTDRSTAFYEALLGVPPGQRSETTAVFDLDSPPLVLTVQQRRQRGVASDRRRMVRAHVPGGRHGSEPAKGFRYTLVVNEPRHVGDAAIALRRAGVRLRLEDQGIEARDPDDNSWRVRFVATAAGRAVTAT